MSCVKRASWSSVLWNCRQPVCVAAHSHLPFHPLPSYHLLLPLGANAKHCVLKAFTLHVHFIFVTTVISIGVCLSVCLSVSFSLSLSVCLSLSLPPPPPPSPLSLSLLFSLARSLSLTIPSCFLSLSDVCEHECMRVRV